MTNKSTKAANVVETMLEDQAFYLYKKVLEQAFSLQGFNKVVEISGKLASACKRSDRNAGAFVATDWALKQLDMLGALTSQSKADIPK